MGNIIQLLHQGQYSCVIFNKEIRAFSKPGVADLYYLLYNDAAFLKGAFIADKVIGNAAAALMILGGIQKVYTDIISLSALVLLRNANIEVHYVRKVPFILNQDQSGWCPLEKICYTGKTAEEILPMIERFIQGKASKDKASGI
jgi:iron complex outermembrane receptor protein/vitamin B12 transporter